jgi:DNA-binding GntR family transcriptional regulator
MAYPVAHPQTLTETAYQKIKAMIIDQKVAPGQRMVCRDLSDQLCMSRTPIINALHVLEYEGFLINEAYRGFYVKPIDPREVWERFAVREALETYAIALAIPQASRLDIEELEQCYENHIQYMPATYDRKRMEQDAAFHLQIACIVRNRALVKRLREAFDHINLRFMSIQAVDPGRMKVTSETHRRLIDKIKQKDVIGSCRLLKDHIRNGRNVCIDSLTGK